MIREFWRTQDASDHSKLVPLFAEDAVLEDPGYGTWGDGKLTYYRDCVSAPAGPRD